jgi:hypothetical protein
LYEPLLSPVRIHAWPIVFFFKMIYLYFFNIYGEPRKCQCN